MGAPQQVTNDFFFAEFGMSKGTGLRRSSTSTFEILLRNKFLLQEDTNIIQVSREVNSADCDSFEAIYLVSGHCRQEEKPCARRRSVLDPSNSVIDLTFHSKILIRCFLELLNCDLQCGTSISPLAIRICNRRSFSSVNRRSQLLIGI